jgi:hypothetical protein
MLHRAGGILHSLSLIRRHGAFEIRHKDTAKQDKCKHESEFHALNTDCRKQLFPRLGILL